MRTILIVCLLGGVMPLQGQILSPVVSGRPSCCTYYVDPTKSDSNNGLTPATAFANVPGMTNCASTCASTSLKPGQIVGLKAGSTWRQALTPGQSGSTGQPITYTSYGTGAQPCIYCEPSPVFLATAETGDMSQWTGTTSTGGTSTITANTTSVYHGTAPGSTGFGFDALSDGTNFAYASKTISGLATIWLKFYIFIPASFVQTNFAQIYIVNLNSSGTTKLHMYIQQQSAGQFQLHSQLNFGSFTNLGTSNFTTGTWHRVDVEYVVNASTGGQQFWFDGTSIGSNFVQNSSGNVDQIQVGMINTTAPNAGSHLYFDTVTAATSSLVATNNAVTITKNNLTFNNIQIANSGDVGIYLHGSASNITVVNCTVHDIDANTFKAAIFNNGSSNNVFQSNTIYNAEDGIAVSGFGSVANSNTQILSNTLYNFGRHAVQIAPAGGTGPDHITVNSNSLSYASLWVNDSVGILIDGTGAGNTANYNVSFNHGTPVYIGSDYDSDLTASGNTWTFNVGYGSTNGCFILSGTGHFVYQNTCYNNNTQANSDGEISLYTSASSITLKDNILYCSASRPVLTVQTGSTTANVFDYNDWFCATTTPFSYAGSSLSFAGYKTASSQDANSITGNPNFTSAPSDFTLQAGSPAIAAGIFISGVSKANPPNIGAK